MIAGLAPAMRPCCAVAASAPRLAEVSPAPCCGPGCLSMTSTGSRSFLIASDGASNGPTLTAAGLGPDRRPSALRGRVEARPVVRDEPLKGPALFVLHSQFLI